ncbi:MAG: carbon storage regulator [Pirellulales bacterium]|nr:carbon storage regulator [Pirellulales bacterium]
MLILSRKPGDSILIDGGIRLTVLEVRGRTIRLGIEAPKHVAVQREELVGPGHGARGQGQALSGHCAQPLADHTAAALRRSA